MKKRWQVWLIIVLFCLFLLGGWFYHQVKENDNTLTLGIYTGSSWGVPEGHQYAMIDYAIHCFHEHHPSVKIVYEGGITKSDYRNWLSNRIVAGKMPDVVIVPNQDFNLLANEGAFKSLNHYFQADHVATNNIYSAALKDGRLGNQQYALPYEANPTLMVANQTFLHKKGIKLNVHTWTPAKLRQVCQQATKIRPPHNTYGITSNYNWQDALLAYHVQPFNENGTRLQLTNNQTKKGFNLIENLNHLVQNHTVSPEMFDRGQVAFMPMTLATYQTYTSYPYHITRNHSFTWRALKMPGIKGARATKMTTTMFAVSAKAKNPRLAWQFVKMMGTDRRLQQRLMLVANTCSVLKSVINSRTTQKLFKRRQNLRTSQLDSIMRSASVLPKFKNYYNVNAHLDYQLQNALKENNIDIQAFQIQQQIQAELQGNN